MAKQRPKTLTELKEIPGLGEAKAARFGAEFLDIIRNTGNPPEESENAEGSLCGGPET